MHNLVEENLQELLGIRLIAREYPIPNGRIDTLGLDEDGLPVIIEYKWKKDLSAVAQGLFYLDWVVQNKKPFESIVRGLTILALQIRRIQLDYPGNHSAWRNVSGTTRDDGVHRQDSNLPLRGPIGR